MIECRGGPAWPPRFTRILTWGGRSGPPVLFKEMKTVMRLLEPALIVTFCSLIAIGAQHTPSESEKTVAELEQLNQRWNKAWLKREVSTVEKLMAKDYVYIAPNGHVLDRQAVLEIIRSPSYHLYNGSRTEVVVKLLGTDAAAVINHWQGEGVYDGRTFQDDHRCSMLCVRRGKEWEIVLEQCSPIHLQN